MEIELSPFIKQCPLVLICDLQGIPMYAQKFL